MNCKKLLLAKPFALETVYAGAEIGFVTLLIHTFQHAKKQYECDVYPYYETGLDENGRQEKRICNLRNNIVKYGLEMGMDYICMLDADMMYPANLITDCFLRHMRDGRKIVCIANYRRGNGGMLYARKYRPDGKPDWKNDAPMDSIVGDSIIAPTGAICIHKEVFKDIGPEKWFETDCEDVDFSKKAIAAGHKIILDTRFHSAHIGIHVWSRQTFEADLEYNSMCDAVKKNENKTTKKKEIENLKNLEMALQEFSV